MILKYHIFSPKKVLKHLIQSRKDDQILESSCLCILSCIYY